MKVLINLTLEVTPRSAAVQDRIQLRVGEKVVLDKYLDAITSDVRELLADVIRGETACLANMVDRFSGKG